MTPMDIQSKRFDKGVGGYRTEDVQEYLTEVAVYVETLLEEKDDLIKKMEVLAEKLEEYREDEDSLRAALIGAQKLGDSVVREAKKKAESILKEANAKVEAMVSDARASIDRESLALNRMRMEVAKFKTEILNMYKRHIEVINTIPYDENNLPEEVRQLKLADAPSSQREPEPEQQPPAEEFPVSYDQVEDDEADGYDLEAAGDEDFPKRKGSRFGPLRFGEEYSLTREE